MTKIKVKINKPDPTPETIRKHKNFHGFVNTYHKLHTQKGIRDMWYRDKKTMAYIAIILVLLLLLLLSEDPQSEKNKEKKKDKIEQTK